MVYIRMKLLGVIFLIIAYILNESMCIMTGKTVPDLSRGALIGALKNTRHGVNGTVFAIDEETFYIEGFNFDGKDHNVFFWYGMDGDLPNKNGDMFLYHETDKESNPTPLPRMANYNLRLSLPEGTSIIKDIKWLSVWSKKRGVDFGHIIIPEDIEVPRVKVLSSFTNTTHGVESGHIEIIDAQNILIPDLHYDGEGPDAYFWAGSGSVPDEHGFKIPNKKSSLEKLQSYEGERITLKLPRNITVYDIDYIAIWCEEFNQSFGHTLISKDDLWVPPALHQIHVQESSKILEKNVNNSSTDIFSSKGLVMIYFVVYILNMNGLF